MRCDSCEVLFINGVRCHETGCPDAWRDELRPCFQCGCDFAPESRHQSVCEDCANPPDDETGEDCDPAAWHHAETRGIRGAQ